MKTIVNTTYVGSLVGVVAGRREFLLDFLDDEFVVLRDEGDYEPKVRRLLAKYSVANFLRWDDAS